HAGQIGVDLNQRVQPRSPFSVLASLLVKICRRYTEGRKFGPSALYSTTVLSPIRTLTYSTTSSASAISDGGTVRPRALAAFRLITKSNFVDCMTGRSAGFSPLRIRTA